MNKDWMSPKEYFERIVRPTVEDYKVDKKDHHKECAIFQLSSFSERYFRFHKDNSSFEPIFGAKEEKDFGNQLTRVCPEYRLLWYAANAVKHQIPGTSTPRSALVTTSTEIWESRTYEVCGRWVTIEEAIDTVYEFWRKRLKAEVA